MGTSKSVPELVGKVAKAGKALDEAGRETVKAAAEVTKIAVTTRAKAATGGDLKLSGAKNKKVGVRVRSSVDRATLQATGPMHWLEGGVKRHAIAPKKLGGSRAARGAFVSQAFGTGRSSLQFGKSIGALKFKDGGFAKYARRAGGLPAKKVWSKGVEDAQEPIRRVFSTKTTTAVAKAFGG